MELYAVGDSGCAGKQSAFDIRENNTGFPDSDVSPDPSSGLFAYNSIARAYVAAATWTAKYQDDGLDFLSPPGPEYFFNVSTTDGNSLRSVDPLLNVTQLPLPTPSPSPTPILISIPIAIHIPPHTYPNPAAYPDSHSTPRRVHPSI